MKLDRNTNPNGIGKYALILQRKNAYWEKPVLVTKEPEMEPRKAVLVARDAIDFGDTPETEFFVIRLKDRYAGKALLAYAHAALADGQTEWGHEVEELAKRAINHPNRQVPT